MRTVDPGVRNGVLAERRSARGRAEHGEPQQYGPEEACSRRVV